MHINEIFDDSKVSHITPGSATLAFSDYVSEISQWMPDKNIPQLKKLGVVLIKAGFTFIADKQHKTRAQFNRGNLHVHLPLNSTANKDMGKVFVTHDDVMSTKYVSMAKAARLDFNTVNAAFEAVADADEKLQALFQ